MPIGMTHLYPIPSTIHQSWHAFFESEFSKPYMTKLFDFLTEQEQQGVVIYPPRNLWFRVFEMPLDEIKAIVIGQDPYINEGQAMGLSFSVPVGEKIPPSLRNIYAELASDLGFESPTHGDLSRWFDQEGIFLLNASLTVESGKAGSHLKRGWQQFTNAVLNYINEHTSHCVFIAWGAFAHKCCAQIDLSRHQVTKTSHPSPLGAYKTMKDAPAFLGSRCFSTVNDYLTTHNIATINWEIK